MGDDGLPQRRLVCWREQAVGKRQLQGPVLGQNAGLGRLCVKPQALSREVPQRALKACTRGQAPRAPAAFKHDPDFSLHACIADHAASRRSTLPY